MRSILFYFRLQKPGFLCFMIRRHIFRNYTKMSSKQYQKLPKLVVFDVDECLLSPDSYLIQTAPNPDLIIKADLNGKGVGISGAILPPNNSAGPDKNTRPWDTPFSDKDEIYKLFPGALQALQLHHSNNYPNTRFSLASSSVNNFTVSCIHSVLQILEVVPGVTILDVLNKNWSKDVIENKSHLQIGRSGKLSSDKSATHFPILKEVSGVEYDEMLFFDDCTWEDHCEIVPRYCPGVVTQRTPKGLQVGEWEAALEKFEKS